LTDEELEELDFLAATVFVTGCFTAGVDFVTTGFSDELLEPLELSFFFLATAVTGGVTFVVFFSTGVLTTGVVALVTFVFFFQMMNFQNLN